MGLLIASRSVERFQIAEEKGRDEDENQHQVSLTRVFYMQTTEVTVGQWRVFVRDTGFKTDAETKGNAWIWIDRAQQLREGYYWDNPGFPQSDSHPVTCVTWNDAQAFIKWLNEKEGKTYRLPAEAEWEYACRAGSTARFNWGNRPDCSRANYGNGWSKECKGRNPMGTTKAGSFEPNPWGLYDCLEMCGSIVRIGTEPILQVVLLTQKASHLAQKGPFGAGAGSIIPAIYDQRPVPGTVRETLTRTWVSALLENRRFSFFLK